MLLFSIYVFQNVGKEWWGKCCVVGKNGKVPKIGPEVFNIVDISIKFIL